MSKKRSLQISELYAKIAEKATAVRIAVGVMIVISFTITFFVFKDIFTYELHHAYTVDSSLYWSVGRGILNGLTPYSEMYENKPIGIYVMSAISFALTNDTILCNVFSCIAAMMITVFPTLILFNKFKNTEKDEIGALRKTAGLMTVLLSVLMITVYTELRSGAFQVEEFGAAFSVLFICLVIKLNSVKTTKQRLIFTLLAAISVSCTVMIKEPFLFVSVCGALLFIDNFNDFIKNLVLPCAAGGVIMVVILGVTGILSPYFSIYITRMLETRISGDSTAFSRGRDLLRVTNDIRYYNDYLYYLILFFAVLTVIRPILKKQSEFRVLYHVLRVALAIFAASFCVGMGGQYFNHHFVFAVPIYCAFVIYGGQLFFEFRPNKRVVNCLVIAVWATVMLASFLCIGTQFDGDFTGRFEALSEKAQYVDDLLDFYGEDRYQYIGFNSDDAFIGLTEHSPQGPIFAQDPDNLRNPDTWFSKSLLEQVEESNIVIVKEYKSPAVDKKIKLILKKEFTKYPAQEFTEDAPDDFNFEIYYRISEFGYRPGV